MTQASRAADAFRAHHQREPDGVWSAPGRVNLIGEHTDYNDGFVLPFALPHRIAVAAAARVDGVLTVASLGDNGQLQTAPPLRLDNLAPGGVPGWPGYPAGVAWVLRRNDIPSTGADLVIAGNVPTGAGLSSSAALECAVALALLGLSGVSLAGAPSPSPTPRVVGRALVGDAEPGPDAGTGSADGGGPDATTGPARPELARWLQRAENEFVGAPTGVLDQTASLCCTAAHVLFLDVRSGELEQVPFDATTADLEVLVVDTRTHHAHADGEYGARRAGCEQAARLLGVPALRDVEPSSLDGALVALPEELRPLVRHVVTENERVTTTVELLRAGRIAEIGPLLTASHASMRDDYRISAHSVDVAVDAALAAGALGARMTGGGFGGSVIALIPRARREPVEQAVRAAFAADRLGSPRVFAAVPSAGAGVDTR